MSILSVITAAIGPVTDLIDQLHTSDEERGKIQIAMAKLENQITSQAFAAQAAIITAEAQGGSWIQSNWRPITMLTFLVLVVADQTGLLAFRLAPEAWTLLQIGLGGYVAGRSLEKMAPMIARAVKRE